MSYERSWKVSYSALLRVRLVGDSGQTHDIIT